LATLKYHVTINAILLNATFHVHLGLLDLTTDYDCEGWLDARPFRHETVPSGNFSGFGPARVTATNVILSGSAKLFVNLIGNKVSVRKIIVTELTFDSLTVNLGVDFVIGGSHVDWEEWNENFKGNFREDFDGPHHEGILERIRATANVIVGRYTLGELIDLIGDGDGGDEGCPPPSQNAP
jgi:hypothetical protein